VTTQQRLTGSSDGSTQRTTRQAMAAVAPSLMRTMNQRVLLDRLFDAGPAIRPQLARDSGLSLPTVIAALNDLEAAGLVRTAARPEAGRGRPAQLYEANPAAGAVTGIDIGREWLHVLVTDLAGNRLSQVDAKITRHSAKALVEHTGRTVDDAVSQAGLTTRSVTHTVIGSPGVYAPQRKRVVHAANLPGWQRPGMAEALAARLGTTVTIDNDSNLAALSEYAYGAARNARQFGYLMIGTGVGLGFVLDGQIYRGKSGAAGEVGYLPIGNQLPAPRPGHPQRGMLEEVLAADAVVRYARDEGLTGRLTAQDVFAAARAGEPAAARAVASEARQLARLVASTCAFLDPELIVIGGGIGQNLDLLEADLREELVSITPMEIPPIVTGALGAEAVSLGAVARGLEIARDTVFSERFDQPSADGSVRANASPRPRRR
jgi:predicted NBD/HSP70 family sugar kinase